MGELFDEIELTEQELEERKDFLELSDRDLELLRELGQKIDIDDRFVDEFYTHLQSFSQPHQLLESDEQIQRLKRAQKNYFRELIKGEYGRPYVEKRLRIGLVHQRIGLESHWYLGGMQYFLRTLQDRISTAYDDPQKARQAYQALRKVAFFDMSLATEIFIHADRQRAQATEKGFRDIIEHSPDGIVIHRGDEVVYVNPVLVDLLGFDEAEQLVGRSIFDFVDPSEVDTIRRRLVELRQTGEPRTPAETTLIRPDGSRLDVEVTGVSLHFQGKPALVTMVRDITDRRRVDAHMMRMDRMITAGTLAAGVGHEINNPLTYISTNLDYAIRQLDGLRDDGEGLVDDEVASTVNRIREALEDAQHGGGRIRDIVDQLRRLGREDEESREWTPAPDEMLEWAIGMASNEIRHRAQVVRDYDELPPVWGKESKLGQVVLNLLVNAAHAVEEGAADQNKITLRAEQSGDGMVCIEVEDTGRGIAPEHMERLFDPFFTTKDVGEGTGLGLHICQTIVDNCGGYIEAESQLGQGSRFQVWLPVYGGNRAVEEDGGRPSGGDDPRRRGRILVVDDEDKFRKALRRLLEKRHDVICVESGSRAIEQLAGDVEFDLVLCDVMMPETTGMDLFGVVAEEYPRYEERLVFMSGGAFTARARQFVEETSNRYVKKPFDARELMELVEEFLD